MDSVNIPAELISRDSDVFYETIVPSETAEITHFPPFYPPNKARKLLNVFTLFSRLEILFA